MKRIIRSLCCLSAAFGGFFGVPSASAAEMPARYRPVEWVELRGGAVFDTERMTEATDEIRFKFAMMAKATNYDSAFGDYEGETITATRVIYYSKTTATDFYVNFMSQAKSCTRVAGVVTTFGEPVEGYLNASHVKLNAKEADLTQTAADPTTKTMSLTSTANVPVRYWYFRIVNKDTGATVLDWTPCRDVETGKYGFWDGEKFIEGDTGDAGEIVGSPIQIAVSDPAPQVFTGEAIEPAVTVTSIDVSGESHVLTEGTDYQVTYAHNVGLGTANVTVVGKAGGVFEGSIATTTFEITAPEPGDVALGGTFAYLRRQMLKDGATFSTAGITVVDAQGKALDPSTYTIHTANTEGTDFATVWATVTSGSYAGQMAIGKVAVVSIEDGFVPTPTDYPYIDGSAYEMPEGYVRLGYIEGSGVGAAIGTGLKPHYSLAAAEAIVEFPDPSVGSPIWCGWKSEGVREFSAEYVVETDFRGFRFRKSVSSSAVCEPFDIPCEVRADARYRVTMNTYVENGVQRHYAQVECNDEVVGRVQMLDKERDNYTAEGGVSLFVRGTSYATCRILSFRVWDYYSSPNFKADYVPALQLSDGAVGYYDFVGKTFKAVDKKFGPPLGKTREWGPVSELTLAVDPVVYGGHADGTAQEPPVVVRDKVTGAVLTAGDDYTLGYSNNENAGMASVVVTGKGAHAGQVTCERFVIPKVFHVTADGTTEGSGETWSSAMTFDAAMAAVVGSTVPSEVWIAGTVIPAAATSYTTASSFAIRGGFVGTETSSLDRVAGARSTVSGNDTLATCLTLTHATGAQYDAVTIDSVEFTRATTRTVWAKGYNFTFLNCAFTRCGNFNWAVDSDLVDHKGENDGGGALRVEAPAANSTWSGWKLVANSYLVMKDCEISDCVSGASAKAGNGALHVFRVNDVTLENCKFLNNKTSKGFGSTYGHAVALGLTSSRGVVRGCEFRGNVSTTKCPQIVNINHYSGDWTFERCVFAGNTLGGDTTYSYGGLIEMQTEDDLDATVDVRNCTFAYNIVADGAAVNAYRGTIRVRNSIFWQNVATQPAQHGCDLITTSADGSCSASYCLFAEKGAACYSRYNGLGTLDVTAETCHEADPCFVTDAWNPETDEATDIDLHLLSGAGYRKNGDETWYLSEGVQSPAIDAGDPDDSVGDEPNPNGGVINLGVYGGTASASKTAAAHPDIAGEITVTWPGEWSQPVVHFTTGGEGAYSASVAIHISTDGGATWSYAPAPLTGIANGQTVDHLVTTCFPPEGKLTVKVTISAAGSDASKQADGIDVMGTLPPCWGKGGGDGIVHIRPGATGKGDGTSWWDAVTTLEEGLALLAPERPELWWAARTNELVEAPAAPAFAIPVTIRGGFAGTESAASQRLPGARSVIDGHGEVGPCFQFSNTASVTLDSIEFVRSSERGLYRAASTGDLLITNCAFRCCGLDEFKGAGAGFNVAGVKGNRVSSVRVVDSQIEGNVAYRSDALNGPSGTGMRADNLRVLELVNCTVRTNVYMSARAGGIYGLMADNTPVTIEGCAFRGNRGASGTSAPSVIQLSGACGGSVIRNSVFAGNYLYSTGAKAGVVEVLETSSTNDVYEIDNCTFAYNYVGQMAAVTVPACVLKVKNSIFHANVGATGVSGNPSIGGVDIASSKTNAVLEVSYSMFDGEGTNYVSAVTEEPVKVSNCIYGDPLFVTTTEAFAELAGVDLSKLPRAGNNYTHPSDAVACSYDLHETRKSPAVDAGDPASDYRREPKPNGRRVTLGCYGNTPEAALSKQGGMLIIR